MGESVETDYLMTTTNTEFFTRKQIAELFQITIPTVLRWEKAGRLRAVRLGTGSVRYRISDVEAFIANGAK